jgi:hypothetical protein
VLPYHSAPEISNLFSPFSFFLPCPAGPAKSPGLLQNSRKKRQKILQSKMKKEKEEGGKKRASARFVGGIVVKYPKKRKKIIKKKPKCRWRLLALCQVMRHILCNLSLHFFFRKK